MPNVFIIFLLRFVVLWLNAFPNANGASTEFSPREIVTGLRMNYPMHCRARFGAYVDASQDSDITNTMNNRTALCIVLDVLLGMCKGLLAVIIWRQSK